MTSAPEGPLHPSSEQVDTTLLRALAVLRVVVAVYAVALNLSRWREFERPVLGWVVMGVIVVWTAAATWLYDDPRRRGLPLLVADVLVAAVTLLSTPYVQSQAMLDRHASTMPSFWVIASVLAWAVLRGWPAGLSMAVLMSLLDLSVRRVPSGTTWGNIFLLLLASGVVGYCAGLIREATEARVAAEGIAAAMTERARLARVVHDGVLQVLTMVQRRGAELGGEAAELGRLAGEQEAALRALVQGDASGSRTAATAAGLVDLAEHLSRLGSRTVTVSGPAHGVMLAPGTVEEVVAAVRACLDNVVRHVGPDAPAWVLLEDVGGEVVVTVRDEGPGMRPGRAEAAAAEGRIGVAGSIRGRVEDLGGSAVLTTAPGQGVEWELRVPTGVRT